MALHTETYQQELVSEEINDVISYRPHWLVRKGNTIFFIILFALLTLTWIIKYPDTITTSARLVALNPPTLINSRVDGKLIRLLVVNEQQVQKGQLLGYMESTADFNQVFALQDWLNKTIKATENNKFDNLILEPLPRLYDLGEIQPGYQVFQNQLAETRQTLAGGYYNRKRGALQKDLQYLSALRNNAYQQQNLITQDQQLQQIEYSAYEKLARDTVISPLELNQLKSKLLSKEQNVKQVNSQITNTDINSHGKEKEMLDLQKTVTDNQQQFHSALLDLKSQVEKWIQQYVLIAPEDGKTIFVNTLRENEFLTAGQSLFYIEPKQTQFYAELMASQKGLGKIRTGQRVMINVESYPRSQFGYLDGVVNYISNIPNRTDSFLIRVDLPEGLQTNLHQNIFFRNNLSAKADIITDNRRLFDRLIGELR